jgi:hypothetical protein
MKQKQFQVVEFRNKKDGIGVVDRSKKLKTGCIIKVARSTVFQIFLREGVSSKFYDCQIKKGSSKMIRHELLLIEKE